MLRKVGTLALVTAAALAAGAAGASGAAAPARAARTVTTADLKELAFRSIGPANMGGRVSAFAVSAKRPATFYVGTGTGGLFKTTNLGTTWSGVFDQQPVASIGAVAVWPRNPDVVWVGTGEANSRNSSSWGNGVYRSLDGGGTWEHCGLEATQNIARVVPDPRDSNTVYVAALGRLWGENPERGVFKTTDGGHNWKRVLAVDARTGAVDLAMDAKDPRTLYAAMYTRMRTPWSYHGGSRVGGIFRTRDGGATWTRLKEGLPEETGRIGLDVYARDPRIVYAVIESDEGGHLGSIEDKSRNGGVFRSVDGGDHWQRMSPLAPRPFYFSQIRVQPDDSSRVYVLGFDLYVSDDGGRTFRAGGARNLHPDLHAMWIDPANGEHLLLGTDGGIYQSFDRARNWDFVDNLALGEFYTVALGMDEPYRVCGGLQDNQAWCGPSATRFEPQSWLDDVRGRGILNDHWFCLGGGDGFYVAIDPKDPDVIYCESQGGSINRVELRTGRRRALKPSPKEGEAAFRFNWNAPFQMSPHDPAVLWLGGNRVFRLYDRGDRWEAVSPDLTTQDPQRMTAVGSSAEQFCTITTLCESPVKQGVIWAGTDDGKLWVTENAGGNWTDLTPRLRGVPPGLTMSRIEASHHDAGTAYLAIDGHRTDHYDPYLLRTTDYGRTWTSIATDFPPGVPVKVVREDPVNPDLLFAGTERGLRVSWDRGAHWQDLRSGLPTVAVDDIAIHPREHDLVVATHGRSIWILDDLSPLEGMKPAVRESAFVLFGPRPATAFHSRLLGGLWGQRPFAGRNPPFGAILNYFVRDFTGDDVSLKVADSTGATVRTLSGSGAPGFHRVVWDLEREARERIDQPEWNDRPVFVPAGRYTVTATRTGSASQKQTLVVRLAPGAENPDLIPASP